MLRNGLLESSGNTLIEGVEYTTPTDYLEIGTHISSSASKMLFSCWIRAEVMDDTAFSIYKEDSSLAPNFGCTWVGGGFDRISFSASNSGEGTYSFASSDDDLPPNIYWRHILASADYSVASGSRSSHLYIDGVDVNVVGSDSGTVAINAFSIKDILKDAASETIAISEFYLTDEYLDLSIAANRKKFITGNHKQQQLGSDGSTPTGTQPLIYLKDPAATAGVNSGSGANFTVNGSPVDVVYY